MGNKPLRSDEEKVLFSSQHPEMLLTFSKLFHLSDVKMLQRRYHRKNLLSKDVARKNNILKAFEK